MDGHGFDYDIGFLGGGQLARMSIQAAQRMGLRCLSLDPDPHCPAAQVADSVTGSITSATDVAGLFAKAGRVTLENEFLSIENTDRAFRLCGRVARFMTPSLSTLALINDKLGQRLTLGRRQVPSPKAAALFQDQEADVPIEETVAEIGFPMVLKARHGGYDGKGVRLARDFESLKANEDIWGNGGWLAEQFVPFRRELAVMVYRSESEVGTFPTMETVQTDHVCDLVFPAGVDASEIAVKAVEAVEGYGLFGVELFELEDGSFQVNEIAPRPHNTGHYTLDWGGVSQFEQHVRLVMGWPCAKPEGEQTCMANLLGQPGAGDYRLGIEAALHGDPDVHVHWYGKAQAKPGRKMGHLNAVGYDAVARAKAARARFYEAWTAG